MTSYCIQSKDGKFLVFLNRINALMEKILKRHFVANSKRR